MSHLRNSALFGHQADVLWTPVLNVRAGNLAAIGDLDNLRLCLHAGVNTGQKSRADNKNGRAALIRACISDQYRAVELVLELGAEVECRDNGTGRTPLIWSAAASRFRIAELLLSHKADLHACDLQFLRQPLGWAAYAGNVDLVKLFLEAGAEIDATDHGGRTALIWASEQGFTSVITELICRKASLECVEDKSGRTALMAAAAHGHLEAVKLMLAAGAECCDVVSHGPDVLQVAVASRNPQVVAAVAVAIQRVAHTRPDGALRAGSAFAHLARMLGQAQDVPSAEKAREKALKYLTAAGASYSSVARLREEELDGSIQYEVTTMAADEITNFSDFPGTRDPTPRSEDVNAPTESVQCEQHDEREAKYDRTFVHVGVNEQKESGSMDETNDSNSLERREDGLEKEEKSEVNVEAEDEGEDSGVDEAFNPWI